MGVLKRILHILPVKQEEVKEVERQEFRSYVVMRRTEDCEYPVIEREILPEQFPCPKCGRMVYEGNEHCDRCGAMMWSDSTSSGNASKNK